MGNCLEIRLKEIVQNDNLLKKGEVVLNCSNNESILGFCQIGWSTATGGMKSLNNDSIDVSGVNTARVNNMPANTMLKVIDKYNITYCSMERTGIDVKELACFNLTQVNAIKHSLRGSFEDLMKGLNKNVSQLNIRENYMELTGDISVFSSLQNLQKLNVSYNSNVTGNCDVLANLPLMELNIQGTLCTISSDTKAALETKGCVVYYNENQIVD